MADNYVFSNEELRKVLQEGIYCGEMQFSVGPGTQNIKTNWNFKGFPDPLTR